MNHKQLRSLALLAAVSLFFVSIFLPLHRVSASINDFTVKSFEADYSLGREESGVSTLQVKEEITAVFPSFDQNHGILRAIPQEYDGHNVNLDVQKVTNDKGQDLPYDEESENGNTVLKIGDPDAYVHGEQTYNIWYKMRGVTLKPDNAAIDEFYWDTNGTQWSQPFGSVVARVIVPKELASHLLTDKACYTGSSGSKAQDCTITAAGDSSIIVTARTNGSLGPGENMTVALAFKKDTFAAYQPTLQEKIWSVLLPILIVLPPIAALVAMVWHWRKYGRDPRGRGVIVPEYLPPKEVSVLGSSAILKEGFDHKAISATIIDLAVRHYVKVFEVTEKKKFRKDTTEYELELTRELTGLNEEERSIVEMIFGKDAKVGTRVKMKSLSNTIYAQADKIGDSVNDRMTSEGYFTNHPSKSKMPFMITGVILFAAGIFTAAFLVGIGLIVAGAILVIGSVFMPARSEKGVQLRDYLFGLKEYMKLAEADRIKVLQSPRGSLTEKIPVGASDNTQLVKLFEKLLPYAMLFGIEKEWAEQFAHLYKQDPDWYSGSHGFQPALFASSLGSFSSDANSHFAPASSSSSSGSGGGGSSGGGGGGGGGGGW